MEAASNLFFAGGRGECLSELVQELGLRNRSAVFIVKVREQRFQLRLVINLAMVEPRGALQVKKTDFVGLISLFAEGAGRSITGHGNPLNESKGIIGDIRISVNGWCHLLCA